MILGIYGAGGLGREALIYASQANAVNIKWNDIVFIDDADKIKELNGKKVITLQEVRQSYSQHEIEVIIAVGEPNVRKILREKVESFGYRLGVLIHPSASVSDDAEVGEGAIITYNSFVSSRARIGKNVMVQPFTYVGHDSSVGDDSLISSFSYISGACRVGCGTYIGINVPIREQISIGDQCIVGMGSVVTKDIPSRSVVFGNPAKVMYQNSALKVFK